MKPVGYPQSASISVTGPGLWHLRHLVRLGGAAVRRCQGEAAALGDPKKAQMEGFF